MLLLMMMMMMVLLLLLCLCLPSTLKTAATAKLNHCNTHTTLALCCGVLVRKIWREGREGGGIEGDTPWMARALNACFCNDCFHLDCEFVRVLIL